MLFTDLYTSNLTTIVVALYNLMKGNGGVQYFFNQDGIPLISYPQIGKTETTPVYLSIYALKYYSRWKSDLDTKKLFGLELWDLPLPQPSTTDDKQRFINCVRKLESMLENYESNGIKYVSLPYNIKWPKYKIQEKWNSAMANGLAISVFIRAYKTLGDQKYKRILDDLYKSFLIPVENNGITIILDNDSYWYEEYASKDAIDSRVLNGMVYSLIGLNEYRQYYGDKNFLFEKGISALSEEAIARYDAGFWTYYDQVGTISDLKYHRIDVGLMQILYEITKIERFKKYYLKWQNQYCPYFIREFIMQKPDRVDVAIIVFSFIISTLFSIIVFILCRKFEFKKH